MTLRLESQQTQQRHGQGGIFIGGQPQFLAAMQTDAVEQLGFISRHGLRQLQHLHGIRVGGIGGSRHIWHGLQHGHALQHAGHFFQRGSGRDTVVAQCIHGFHHSTAIALRQRANQTKHIATVHTAQHLAHGCFLQLATAKGNGLIRQRQCIAHGTARGTREQLERLGLCGNAFLGQHLRQVLKHGLGCHGPQIELQAAREHRDRHLLRISRSQYKLEVLGRLLQRLQHGVEGGVGEHVHLVDHEDLEAPLHGLVHRLLQQALHLIHTTVGGRVQLDIVRKAAAINFSTCRADTTRRSCDFTLAIWPGAIDGLGKNTRDRGLAHTTCASEQVRMVQTLLRQRVAQRLHDVLLPHHFGEVAGTVFTSEHEIRHRR